MAANVNYADATELAELIRTGKLSSVDVVQAHLDRVHGLNPSINAIVTLNKEALNEAKAADQAIQHGGTIGPLHGVPFTVKDSIDTAGVMTQRGSPIFRGRTPTEDATSVTRMKAAGAILLGKTNLPEFSYATESSNLLNGLTRNPWNLDRTPGGSSGGESAAIAADMSPLGLGTDLAISVRGPAAQTGIVALKPTHGRVPMTGVWPREPRRFWHTGPMARSIRDLKLAFEVLSGPDGQDSLSSRFTPESSLVGKTADEPTYRVGWLVRPGLGPIQKQVGDVVEAAAKTLGSVGCEVEPVQIQALERDPPLEVFEKIYVNEMKPPFEQATAGRSDNEIGHIARYMLGLKDSTMTDFLAAEQASDRLKDAFAEFFTRYDVLLCPVLPFPAHEHNLQSKTVDGQEIDGVKIMAATVAFNVTGLPALSMPFGLSEDGLPIGIQLVGAWQAEKTILDVAAKLEAVSPMKGKHPKL